MGLPAASNSSSVKVIYTDPSNIFPLICDDLSARLPLRNLHWNSPSRPLRSIDSLFVEFVSEDKKNVAAENSEIDDLAGEAIRTPELKKERRHQIPGLRQTPYLKIFLFRCDDIESYKSSWRKTLREWIKENTPTSQSNFSSSNQENHDAFEWMIIHVALLDATSGSGWPSRVQLSVIDKVKADFQGSSKSQISRIAQLLVPEGIQDQAVMGGGLSLARLEREDVRNEIGKAWEDLLIKVKILILASFDLRVRQYEEDIKEKGSQRKLPGWNFCTFFILKEGLARGFESVGLVEDALIGYDELSVELQNATSYRKMSSPSNADLFLDYTEELFEPVSATLQSAEHATNTSSVARGLSSSALDAEHKPFRKLILGSNISAYDFQTYVFARQFSLLSRLAKLTSTGGPINDSGEPEDVLLVTEITRRTIMFVTAMGSIIREDLHAAFQHKAPKISVSDPLKDIMIEELIASWTYNTCQQVLEKTNIVALLKPVHPNLSQTFRQKLPMDPEPPADNNISMQSPSPKLPVRTSSLQDRSSPISTSSGQDVLSDSQSHPPRSPIHHQLQHSVRCLAAQRAELYLIARRSLQVLGLRRGWETGWISTADDSDSADSHSVSLNDSLPEARDEVPARNLMIPTIYNNVLARVLSSKDAFYQGYEEVSLLALDFYRLSSNWKSAQSITADIAMIKFFLKDYEAAVSCVQQMASFYAEENWKVLEVHILQIYTQCLKELNRMDEYAHVALEVLAKGLDDSQPVARYGFKTGSPRKTLNTLNLSTGSFLDLIDTSKKLKEPVHVPLDRYFRKTSLDPYIQHLENQDGFQMILNLLSVIPDEVNADKVKIHIVNTSNTHSWDIWLSSAKHVLITPGRVQIPVTGNAMLPGWYVVDKIMISCEQIVFTYEGSPIDKATSGPSMEAQEQPLGHVIAERSSIRLWPACKALRVCLRLCHEIHLEQLRSIVIEIHSGHNDIDSGDLLLRASSAGLRLQTSDFDLLEGKAWMTYESSSGLIRFKGLLNESTLKLRIPYRLENDMKEISVRTEVRYSTRGESYTYGDVFNVSILLPLGVNVQDIFKRNSLFSKFAISASTSVPLRLLKCRLEGTDDFEAVSIPMEESNLFVSPKQPVSMVCRIARRSREYSMEHSLGRRLSMHIEYQCLDEEICTSISNQLLTDLSMSNFAKFCRLLQPWVEMATRSRLLNYDLDAVGLSREVGVGSFDEFSWQRLLEGVPGGIREDLGLWLQEWHQKRQTIELSHRMSELDMRHIIIPVDVPGMHIIHSACLSLSKKPSRSNEKLGVLAIGEAIPLELTLKHSRRWSAIRALEGGKEIPLGFYYEIEANPDTWLVAGQRRAFFSATEDQVLKFPVILIPQRPGRLPYPAIEIRHVEGRQGQDSALGSPALSCDVDYQSQGESIHVVRNLGSTTMGLDVDGPRIGEVQLFMTEHKNRKTKLGT